MTNREKIKQTMKRIIDIPEEDYNYMMECCPDLTDLMNIYEQIKNSTPLNEVEAEDCISREQALVAIRNLYPGMPRVDFNGSLRKWVDKYKPYIECDDAIKQLPSVTPQEPKTGHWISDAIQGEIDGQIVKAFTCSKCGAISVFRMTDGKIVNGDLCPNCGAKMVEPQESEDNK